MIKTDEYQSKVRQGALTSAEEGRSNISLTSSAEWAGTNVDSVVPVTLATMVLHHSDCSNTLPWKLQLPGDGDHGPDDE